MGNRPTIPVLACLLLANCAVGPNYQRPTAPVSVAFKELDGWKAATPMDGIDRGAWWLVFNDPELDRLERMVIINNQTVIAAEAAYREAVAVTAQARASLFPVVGATLGATRGGTGNTVKTTYTVEGTVSWEIDVWGKIRRQIESNKAAEQASAADYANAALSAQGTLATDYFSLRYSDALKALLDRTVVDDQRALDITQNQYAVGVAAKSDVITAETELRTVQAQDINVGVARQQFEHAIAVLSGQPPSALTLAPGLLTRTVPVAPVSVPSAILERRPDIAAAERTMQEQNAAIGVAIAGYYPTIDLSALLGFVGNPISALFTVPNRVWSLGAAASGTLYNGALSAQVAQARATYDESVANYRQTVLTAFQQVEDALSTLRILQQQQGVQEDAVQLARRAVDIALNQYRAGTVAYTTVVTAQITALSDEQTLLSIENQQLAASVALIQALGGGWSAADLAGK